MARFMLKDEDGRTVTDGDDAGTFVQALFEARFNGTDTVAGYMDDVARRVRLMNGATVRTDNVADFVADLVAAGVVIEQE